ncbi:MAG: Mrp/NBP35 family ATP-binding protein [Pseudomonadota bacterium]|nr:Mrp/NBP35 family ATP-binding protein [Pseudomonadota bacterium]
MNGLTEENIRNLLTQIKSQPSGRNILSDKMVKSVDINDQFISIVLEIDPTQAEEMKQLNALIETKLEKIKGSRQCRIILTSHVDSQGESTTANPSDKGPPPSLKPKNPQISATNAKPEKLNPEGVTNMIAIASGKGGVGKSTVAANLATALAVKGKKIGLLDADVYGPSQPRMFGLSGRPASPDGKTILPLRNHGVTVMSLGLMVPENEAIVWRGPMLMGALQQMLTQVQWGELDLLIVDLPPGTGDVQLTLSQKTDLFGAIVVSTPQDVALLDARKGIDMFRKLNVPIIGLIENMSSFKCSDCGSVHHPFGKGTLEAEALKIGTEVIADLPLDLETRMASDNGSPIVITDPQGAVARAFSDLADQLISTKLFE